MNLELPLNEPRPADVTAAIAALATSGGREERGAVFTKAEVVGAILDLCGYTQEKKLPQLRLLEPSFGGGDFLLPAVDRLMAAYKTHGGDPASATEMLSDAVRGVELHKKTFDETSESLRTLLVEHGLSASNASLLVSRWLVNDDFLLSDLEGHFDFVVGNPPLAE